jgi:hypothetical protein
MKKSLQSVKASNIKSNILNNKTYKYMKTNEIKNIYHSVLRNSKGREIAVVFQDKITNEIKSIWKQK